jgi:hypothetical protein
MAPPTTHGHNTRNNKAIAGGRGKGKRTTTTTTRDDLAKVQGTKSKKKKAGHTKSSSTAAPSPPEAPTAALAALIGAKTAATEAAAPPPQQMESITPQSLSITPQSLTGSVIDCLKGTDLDVDDGDDDEEEGCYSRPIATQQPALPPVTHGTMAEGGGVRLDNGVVVPGSAEAAAATAAAAPGVPPVPPTPIGGGTTGTSLSTPTTSSLSSATTSGGIKTANFSEAEDMYLAEAYVHVTSDNVKGTGQKTEEFWKAVLGYYNQLLDQAGAVKIVDRNWTSMRTRFKRMQKDTSVYVAIHKQVLTEKPSGYTEEDITKLVGDRYRAQCRHNFKFFKCLVHLTTLPKFDAKKNSVKAAPTTGNSTPLTSPMGGAMARPVGRDRSKQVTESAAGLAGVVASQTAAMEKHMSTLREETSKITQAIQIRGQQERQDRARVTHLQAVLAKAKFEQQMGNLDAARIFFDQAFCLTSDGMQQASQQSQAADEEATTQRVNAPLDTAVLNSDDEEEEEDDDFVENVDHLVQNGDVEVGDEHDDDEHDDEDEEEEELDEGEYEGHM